MKKLFVTFLSALALCSTQAAAQVTSDLGTWSSIHVVKSFGPSFATARLEHRSYDHISNTECWFAMVGGGYSFNSWLKGDMGYEYWSIPSAGNLVQHKAVFGLTGTLKREGLAVSLREKYELAYNPAAETFGSTLRSRLRGQYRASGSILTPYAMYEMFNNLDNGKWVRSLHYAGTEISLGGGHALDLFYLYHLFEKGGQLAACHVLGVCYMFVF